MVRSRARECPRPGRALDTATDEPAVEIVRRSHNVGIAGERGAHARVGVATAQVDKGLVVHQITCAGGKVEAVARIDRQCVAAGQAAQFVVESRADTGLGTEDDAFADLLIVARIGAQHEGFARNVRVDGSSLVDAVGDFGTIEAALNTDIRAVEAFGVGRDREQSGSCDEGRDQ